ncbi:hypothetical protein AOLI_G00281370 [Acnodon oligacanthus]
MLAKERRGHAHKGIPANQNQQGSSPANRPRRSSAEEPIAVERRKEEHSVLHATANFAAGARSSRVRHRSHVVEHLNGIQVRILSHSEVDVCALDHCPAALEV